MKIGRENVDVGNYLKIEANPNSSPNDVVLTE